MKQFILLNPSFRRDILVIIYYSLPALTITIIMNNNIIGVRQINRALSLARRHAALTVHERIDLHSLLASAETTTSLVHVVEHIILLLSTSLALAKRQNDHRLISVTSKALKYTFACSNYAIMNSTHSSK